MNESYLITLYLFGILVLAVFAIGFILLVSFQKQRQARHTLEKKELEFKHQTDLLQTRLDVQEQSMNIISEEIHDNVGQLLSVAQMYLHTIAREVRQEPAKELVDKSKALVSKAIAELRHISHSLNSNSVQELGVVGSLERDIQYISAPGLECSFDVQGLPYSLSREQDLLLFRIIQEAIQNVIKHAHARHVRIGFVFGETGLNVTVEDDGIGFDPLVIEKNGSLGITNMKSRAALLNSDIIIDSQLGKGSILQLQVPKTPSHEYS